MAVGLFATIDGRVVDWHLIHSSPVASSAAWLLPRVRLLRHRRYTSIAIIHYITTGVEKQRVVHSYRVDTPHHPAYTERVVAESVRVSDPNVQS